jgi:hypothetical protein
MLSFLMDCLSGTVVQVVKTIGELQKWIRDLPRCPARHRSYTASSSVMMIVGCSLASTALFSNTYFGDWRKPSA